MISGVIFDLDGLLFDTEQVYCEVTQKVAKGLGMPYTKETYLQFLGVSDEEMWAGLYDMYTADYGVAKVAALIEQSYAEVQRIFAAGQIALKPGVRELLAFLSEAGVQCTVASSNTRLVVEQLLEQAEIDHYFAYLVTAEDVISAKPDPAIFNLARKKMRLSTEQLVILEDSLNGVKAASAAQIPVIMVPDLVSPTAEIKEMSMAVLKDLLAVKEFLMKK